MTQVSRVLLTSAMLASLDIRIADAQAACHSLVESRDSASKSTAGDKHETGRSMMEAELVRAEKQLQKALRLRADLRSLPTMRQELAESGALVATSRGTFFLSVPWGKVEVGGAVYFALSPAAPLAQMMLGKSAGDSFIFQGNDYQIISVH